MPAQSPATPQADAAPPIAGLAPPPPKVLAALRRLANSGQLIPLARQIEFYRETAEPEYHPFCNHTLELAKGFRIKELRTLLGRYD